MTGYGVVWDTGLALLAGAATLCVLGGYVLCRMPPSRWRAPLAWTLAVFSVSAGFGLSVRQPQGIRMLCIVAMLLYGMKAVAGVVARSRGMIPLTLPPWIAFTTLWFGMDPHTFANAPPCSGLSRNRRAAALAEKGTVRLSQGMVLFSAAKLLWHAAAGSVLEPAAKLGATLLLLPALSLMLHFGVFDLLAAFWRCMGKDCQELFRSPLRSRSLAEFWGMRWNLAYVQMTSAIVYRPIYCLYGQTLATLATFAFSGILHELAISVPVRASYGLPTLYFLIQGGLVLVERQLGIRSRLWTIACAGAPLPILFHLPFLRGVVWPILGA